MAITSSAKKAIRSSARKRIFNIRRVGNMRRIVKDIKKLVAEKKTNEANSLLPQAYKAIDKAAESGIIKENNAARKKSRLSRFINKTT